MKIAIDAGHGLNTAGKRCPDDSMREFHFNSVVARYVRDELDQYGNVEILFTHDDTGKRDIPLKERTDKANKWGADVLVSIHANASGNDWGAAKGIETFVYTSRPAESVRLAEAVQEALIAVTGLVDRGVKAGNLHMVREAKMTAILCECGFMTNREEAALLKSDEYRRKCAQAIVKGIVEVYGLEKGIAESQLPVIQREVGLIVNGKKSGKGYLIDNVSYVPIRFLGETFGAEIGWDGANVIISRGDN
ncbi:N-acetylmuramoyl-L-alanine amidase [Paenibacillus sp. TRM 82003]|nr:N-acetylmuramoyl-L-alanine amidase [Paenibacillus sp. TRM 82003]